MPRDFTLADRHVVPPGLHQDRLAVQRYEAVDLLPNSTVLVLDREGVAAAEAVDLEEIVKDRFQSQAALLRVGH